MNNQIQINYGLDGSRLIGQRKELGAKSAIEVKNKTKTYCIVSSKI